MTWASLGPHSSQLCGSVPSLTTAVWIRTVALLAQGFEQQDSPACASEISIVEGTVMAPKAQNSWCKHVTLWSCKVVTLRQKSMFECSDSDSRKSVGQILKIEFPLVVCSDYFASPDVESSFGTQTLEWGNSAVCVNQCKLRGNWNWDIRHDCWGKATSGSSLLRVGALDFPHSFLT